MLMRWKGSKARSTSGPRETSSAPLPSDKVSIVRSHRLLCLVCSVLAAAVCLGAAPAENDLDELMKQVVARRDEGWKKLQQYVFDEREQIEMRGTNRLPIWGEKREYTWFIRDGFFVRSRRVQRRTIGEAERSSKRISQAGAGARQTWPRRRQRQRHAGRGDGSDRAGRRRRHPPDPHAQFISSAYFLRFKFDPGKARWSAATLDATTCSIELCGAPLYRRNRRRDRKKDASAEDRARRGDARDE